MFHPNRTIDGHGAGHTFAVAFHTFRGYRAQPRLRRLASAPRPEVRGSGRRWRLARLYARSHEVLVAWVGWLKVLRDAC